jgi:outer membrane protein OmpU
MKKVLLTTTALVLTAGVASAEITFSGTGEAGFYRTAKVKAAAAPTKGCYTVDTTDNEVDYTATTTIAGNCATTKGDVLDAEQALAADLASTNNADTVGEERLDLLAAELNLARQTATAAKKAGDMKAYSGYDMNVAASAASDNGMTFAFGFDMGAGHIADQDDDRTMDAQGATIAADEVTITYNGYTIKIGDDLIDDLYDDDVWNGDVSLSGAFGDLTFAVVTDLDKDVAAAKATFDADTAKLTPAVAAEYNPTSYSIGYSMGDMSFGMAGTDHDQFGNAAASYSLTYALMPSLSATLSSDNLGTYKDVGKLSATYTLSDSMSITASVKDDKDHALNTNTGGKQSNDFSIAYSAGVLSATVATDESSNWWVNAKYDLGGGATAFTTFDHSEFLVAGVNFAF